MKTSSISIKAAYLSLIFTIGLTELVSAQSHTLNNPDRWSNRYNYPGVVTRDSNGEYGFIRTMVADDDYLYMGGYFPVAGGKVVNNLARWKDGVWESIGGGTNQPDLFRSHVYPEISPVKKLRFDAKGDLYAVGSFRTIGNVTSPGIGRWDGYEWHGVGGGFPHVTDNNSSVDVRDIVFGENDDIYVAGFLPLPDGSLAHIAKWDGQSWEYFKGISFEGRNGNVYSLEYAAGNLYVGGQFDNIDGRAIDNLAVWDGETWKALSGGVNGKVFALKWHEDKLYVGGVFGEIANFMTQNFAVWNGQAWSVLFDGTRFGALQEVRDISVIDGNIILGTVKYGTSNSIIINFPQWFNVDEFAITYWDGSRWGDMDPPEQTLVLNNVLNYRSPGDSQRGSVYSVVSYRGNIIAGGSRYNGFGGVKMYDRESGKWYPLTSERTMGLQSEVEKIVKGKNDEIVVAGHSIYHSQNGRINRLAKFDGSTWKKIGDDIMDGIEHQPYEIRQTNLGNLYMRARTHIGSQSQFLSKLDLDQNRMIPIGTLSGYSSVFIHEYDDGILLGGTRFITFNPRNPFEQYNSNYEITCQTGFLYLKDGDMNCPRSPNVDFYATVIRQKYVDSQLYILVRYWVKNEDGTSSDLNLGILRLNSITLEEVIFEEVVRIWSRNTASDRTRDFCGGVTLAEFHCDFLIDGDKIYFAGDFTQLGGKTINRIGYFQNGEWYPLGFGLHWHFIPHASSVTNITALEKVGNILFVGGQFDRGINSNGAVVESRGIIAWDGSEWISLAGGIRGSGVYGNNSPALALRISLLHMNDHLYVTGFQLTYAGGKLSLNVAEFHLGDEIPIQEDIYPISGATGVPVNPVIRWEGNLSAKGYNLRFREVGGNGKTAPTIAEFTEITDLKVPEYRFPESTLTYETTYEWSYQAITEDEELDSWSSSKTFTTATATSIETEEIPFVYTLGQNYPNPFNPSTTIQFSIRDHEHVRVELFDLLGRKVAVLANEIRTPGLHTISFKADNLATGVYFYRLITPNFTETKKMMFLK